MISPLSALPLLHTRVMLAISIPRSECAMHIATRWACNRRLSALLLIVISLNGCVALPKVTTPFDKAEFEKCQGVGSSSISGIVQAGRYVGLFPDNTYVRELLRLGDQSLSRLENHTDQDIDQYVKSEKANQSGYFQFSSLKPCKYILRTTMEKVLLAANPSNYGTHRVKYYQLTDYIYLQTGQSVNVKLDGGATDYFDNPIIYAVPSLSH